MPGRGRAAGTRETPIWVLITQRSQVQILPPLQMKLQVRALLRLRSGALSVSQGVSVGLVCPERDPKRDHGEVLTHLGHRELARVRSLRAR